MVCAALLFGFSSSQKATASHFQGSEISYICLAPGLYTVNLRIYRDCTGSGVFAPQLNIKSVGCNAGRNIPFAMTAGGTRQGDPYCAAIPKACSAPGRPNFEEVNYYCTVTFSAAEQSCPEWLFSWSECCRPEYANLQQAAGSYLYTEAMVRLDASINNNSPQFGRMQVPVINFNQPIQVSSYALETDGDSLVYRLENPLDAYNTPVTHNSYPAIVVYNSDSTKNITLPAGNYSNTLPLLSYAIDWSQPMPVPAIPHFAFNSRNGSLQFTPLKYVPNSPILAGENRYAIVVQVDEYRKINGASVKIGSVRRDMFFHIFDNGTNQNPKVTATVANGQPIAETDLINLGPGTPLSFQFASSDANSADVLTLESNVSTVLPGATFTSGSGNQPAGTISWTPSASHVRDQPYYFHVTVTDNACPLKGVQVHTFGVKVSATGGVTGVKDHHESSPVFSAYPNPFTDEIYFKFSLKTKAESIVIFNLLGRQVDQISLSNAGLGNQTIPWKNAGKFAAGIYVAKIKSADNSVETLKFTKLQ